MNKMSNVESVLPASVVCADLNGASSDETDRAADNWGFSVEELYKLALQFYKDKEGMPALQISYSDRIKLAALTKQVTHGKYRADVATDIGLLDRIGQDRRALWQSLGDMSRDTAMSTFTTTLLSSCPALVTFIEEHQTQRFLALNKLREEAEARRREQEQAREAEMKRQEAEQEEIQLHQQALDQQRAQQLEQQIRSALIQQTEIHFRQYAKQQIPDNEQQQAELVSQLQEQHYDQYIQHVHSQLVLHQRQQYAQLQALTSPGLQSQAPPPDPPQNVEFHMEGTAEDVQGSLLQPVDGCGLEPVDVRFEEKMLIDGLEHVSLQDTVTTDDGGSTVATVDAGSGRLAQDEDDSDAEDADTDSYSMDNLPALIPALLWTRKDIREFKDSLRKNPENVLRVSSLSTATVRVPTHRRGSSVFWEFATDNYDIGFGVYFEWNLEPPTQVSVQVSESSDEEDIEEEFAEGAVEGAATKGDIERGCHSKKDVGPPTDEIIQVYRRDSHEEVYCGSHSYPGRGVYLLKFDNSYSLWRSKTVYYRVFYSTD